MFHHSWHLRLLAFWFWCRRVPRGISGAELIGGGDLSPPLRWGGPSDSLQKHFQAAWRESALGMGQKPAMTEEETPQRQTDKRCTPRVSQQCNHRNYSTRTMWKAYGTGRLWDRSSLITSQMPHPKLLFIHVCGGLNNSMATEARPSNSWELLPEPTSREGRSAQPLSRGICQRLVVLIYTPIRLGFKLPVH